jgi:hypothetical protein
MSGEMGPTGSLTKISIRDSAALVLRGAIKAAALVASTLPTNVRRAILFMVIFSNVKCQSRGRQRPDQVDLLLH